MSLNTGCLVVRGNNVAYCPVAHSFAIVTSADSALIYVDKQKMSIEVSLSGLIYDLSIFRLGGANLEIQLIKNYVLCQVKTHLKENGIAIKEYTEVNIDVASFTTNELDYVSTSKSVNGKHQTGEESRNLIWADPASCCYALYSKLNPDTIFLQQSPLALPQALKGFQSVPVIYRFDDVLVKPMVIFEIKMKSGSSRRSDSFVLIIFGTCGGSAHGATLRQRSY
ncbi:hypothetical protein RYX36_005523 [Vicia faba]